MALYRALSKDGRFRIVARRVVGVYREHIGRHDLGATAQDRRIVAGLMKPRDIAFDGSGHVERLTVPTP